MGAKPNLRKRAEGIGAIGLLVASLVAVVSPTVVAAQVNGASSQDIDGDGYDDLVIGIPFEDIGARAEAGAAMVVYGATSGVDTSVNDVWSQATRNIAGASEAGDLMGASVATGDFNGDGFADLVTGNPGEEVGGARNAGSVSIIYGSSSGASATATRADQLFTQDSNGIQDLSEENDRFGAALATGDFNGDGFEDLAIGAPGENGNGRVLAGGVAVLYGSSNGLRSASNDFFLVGVIGPFQDDRIRNDLGAALAAGDLDGDGHDDLVVGAPSRAVAGNLEAGAITILTGSASGLSEGDAVFIHQNSPGVAGVPQTGDRFGSTVAVGDANGDGFDDVAIGIPNEDLGGRTDVGAVSVIFGSANGADASAGGGDQLWHQNSAGIPGANEVHDLFGTSLAFSDFDNDGFDDLAIGVVGETIGTRAGAGGLNVIYGSATGPSINATVVPQFVSQNSGGVAGSSEAGDRFGESLGPGDYNGDGYGDLAIGVPGEALNGVNRAGAVSIIYGSANGLSATGPVPDQLLEQGSAGLGGGKEVGDQFGAALGSQCGNNGCTTSAAGTVTRPNVPAPVITSTAVSGGRALVEWTAVRTRGTYVIPVDYPDGSQRVYGGTFDTFVSVDLFGQSGEFCVLVVTFDDGPADFSEDVCFSA